MATHEKKIEREESVKVPIFVGTLNRIENFENSIQAWIAQLVAYRLGTGEVPGSKPGKGENFSVKIGTGWFEFEYE